MVEKRGRLFDGGDQAGALLTNLSKVFDWTMNYTKQNFMLEVFNKNSLLFISSYLKGWKQRTKINSSSSVFAEVLFGVPQGSILEPFLLNICICDLIFENNDIDFAN